MSLTGALDSALTGLQASTTAVQIIGSNVSNAQTPGYTEKTLNLSQNVQGTQFAGVSINGYSRTTDSVLTTTLNNATTNASYLGTQNGYLSQIQSILDSSSNPPALSADLSAFQAAWTTYASAPEDITEQTGVISTGEQLASAINTIASSLQTLQTNVQDQLSTNVSSLNTDLQQIQNYNTQISTALADGQSAGDLEDQRDAVVNKIAALTNVQVMQRSNGAIAVYTSSGLALVDGQAQSFSVSNNTIVNSVGANVGGSLGGGTLQAQTDFLSTDTNNTNSGVGVISKLTTQLQGLVNSFTSTASGGFAATYDAATGSSGELNSQFFTAATDANGNPEIGSFAVNSQLINQTATVKSEAANNISSLFNSDTVAINLGASTATGTFSNGGLTVQNQTYAGITSSILSYFQQAANNVSAASSSATAQQTYYQSALTSETGVNTDSELVNLTSWQNSYAASAHVISTIEQLYTILDSMVQ